MSKIRFCGDVHGKWRSFRDLVRESPYPVRQVGDFGVGFKTEDFFDQCFGDMTSEDFQFIRGNHDHPTEVHECEPHYIPDLTVQGDVMYLGGAFSIDYYWRTPGVNWWPDEEASVPLFEKFLKEYEEKCPRIMVTHDCPNFLTAKLDPKSGPYIPTRTRYYFEAALTTTLHRPHVWVFGHHHKSFDQVINGTRFICLNELETVDLEV